MPSALAVFFAVIDRLSGFASEDVADNEPGAEVKSGDNS